MTIAFGINTTGLDLSLLRLRLAAESRQEMAQTGIMQFIEVATQRSARSVYGHDRPNPFLRDLLLGAFAATDNRRWYGYVHADIVFAPSFSKWIALRESLGDKLLTCNRLNTPECQSLLEIQGFCVDTVELIPQNQGVEMMLVHQSVLNDFLSRLPDVVVGIDGWGRVVRALGRHFQLHHCDSHDQTPLRHVVHADHPGKRRSPVRRLNSEMLKAIRQQS